MFTSALTSSPLTLFSSSASHPLTLFSIHHDAALPDDSFVCLLADDSSLPSPPTPQTLISPPALSESLNELQIKNSALSHHVLHIQSPTIRSTYIRCPPLGSAKTLDLRLPWIHMQVRNLNREWSFEIGIADINGREGRIRCSTFQVSQYIHPTQQHTHAYQQQPKLYSTVPPLLHLPLSFPKLAPETLTAWCTVALYIPSILPHFSSSHLLGDNDISFSYPLNRFSHITSIKVFANCRLRRIWLSDTGNPRNEPWEYGMYASS